MKQVLLCAVLAVGASSFSPRAVSGPYADELAQCVVASTDRADRQALVQWMIGALSLHPSVRDTISLPAAQRDAYDVAVVRVYERLITEACVSQVRATMSKEGTDSVRAAFEQLGKLAAEEAFSDPAVGKGMQNMQDKIDGKRVADALWGKLMSLRIGQGYDVHAFGDGDHVMLGGVRVAHERGVLAHSDGDVVLHALCDAMLGALALGDIGQHFPPSDERWRGADSRQFLRHCRQLIGERGYRLGNADITVVCERPKVGPHAAAMRAAIAADLGVDIDAISVKATTTEQLGFTGRREGIAAMAVCLLLRD